MKVNIVVSTLSENYSFRFRRNVSLAVLVYFFLQNLPYPHKIKVAETRVYIGEVFKKSFVKLYVGFYAFIIFILNTCR